MNEKTARKLLFGKYCGAAILSFAFAFAVSQPAFGHDLQDHYPLAQGNSWSYAGIEAENNNSFKTILEEKVDGEEAVGATKTTAIGYSNNYHKYLAFDQEGLKIYKDLAGESYELFEPAMVLFPDLETGQSKSYQIKRIKYDKDGSMEESLYYNEYRALEAVETVTVAAGKFENCLKFTLTSTWRTPDGLNNKNDCSTWLAPGIGKVKEFCVYSRPDPVTHEENVFVESYELTSAVINGKLIEKKQLPPPQRPAKK